MSSSAGPGEEEHILGGVTGELISTGGARGI